MEMTLNFSGSFPNKLAKRSWQKNWGFAGYIESYKPHHLLSTLLKWVLIGPHNSDKGRIKRLENTIDVAIQVTTQNAKSNIQTQSHQQRPESLPNSKIETPLNIALEPYFYHISRSEKLIIFLSNLNLSANYQTIVSIKEEKYCTSVLLQKKTENNGVFVRSNIITKSTNLFHNS